MQTTEEVGNNKTQAGDVEKPFVMEGKGGKRAGYGIELSKRAEGFEFCGGYVRFQVRNWSNKMPR